MSLSRVVMGDYATYPSHKTNQAQFGFVLNNAAKQPVTLPVKQDPTQQTPGNTAVFGPHDPENGVLTYPIQVGGPWPFQIYRSNPFGFDTNDEVHQQLAGTPGLDPMPFGNRPGAPANADRSLQLGYTIIVLDRTRLDFLEEQRTLLSQVMPHASSDSQVTRQDQEITELADSIYGEVDYATMGQAVPDFESVAKNIRLRAPDDKTYQRAIDEAKAHIEGEWKAQGRTADQIGVLLKAGEAGDFTKVHDLAKAQFIAIADALGPNATPEAITAAITARASVYTMYVTGDPRYTTAITQAAGDASHEILVERPIQSVLAIANAGGEDWQEKAIAKLRQVTDPSNHMAGQVLAIMDDPRIQHLVRQSVRHTESLNSPDEGQIWTGWNRGDTIFKDLSAIYDATFYADGKTPGKGKQLVDDMAGFFVEGTSHMLNDVTAQNLGYTIDQAFFESGSYEGHVALGLAIAAKAKGTDNKAFTGVYSPLNAIAEGIKNYHTHIDDLMNKTAEDGAFISTPLASVGAYLSPQQRLELVDKMLAAAPPDKVKKLNDDIVAWTQALNQREPLQYAMDAYAPALNGEGRYKDAVTALGNIPKPDPLAPTPGITPTNSLWLDRSVRLLGTELAKDFAKWKLPPQAYEVLFDGKNSVRVVDRLSRGFSTFLFAANSVALLDSPQIIDKMYVPVHGAMAASEASKAFLPNSWKEWLGTSSSGAPRRLSGQALYAAAEARINGMTGVSNATKAFYRGTAARLFLDTLDSAYLFVDLWNSGSYFLGNTEDGKSDPVRGFAYLISAAGDAAFLIGAGVTGAGALAGGTALGLSAAAWTGIGAALLVIASGINYIKGMHDHAHEFDAQTAQAWTFLGIKDPKVAEALAEGKTFGDGDSYKNAGPFLMEAFHRAGYTVPEMIDYINKNWTADKAATIASLVKNSADRDDPNAPFPDSDFGNVERTAQLLNIPFPVA